MLLQSLTFLAAGSAHFSNVYYAQWNPESYLSKHERMKFLQYGTGCAGECSEVTKSTVPYLLKDFSNIDFKFYPATQTMTVTVRIMRDVNIFLLG